MYFFIPFVCKRYAFIQPVVQTVLNVVQTIATIVADHLHVT